MPSPGWHDYRVKPSGKFEARWAEPDPRAPHRLIWVARGKTFVTKEQAKRYARDRAVYFQDVRVGLRDAEYSIEMAVGAFLSRPGIQDNAHGTNEFVLTKFFARYPHVKFVAQLTDTLIAQESAWLKATKPDSPGGQWHILKTLKAFCAFCVDKEWLRVTPFPRTFKLPRSNKEGRALTEKEFELMIQIRGHSTCVESDKAMRQWLILQRYTMTRISTVFNLMTDDFRNNGTEMRVPAIKHQERVWAEITHPAALAVVKELLASTPAGERLFRHWKTIEMMRKAFRTKAGIMGLGKLRPHDACKVTEVTSLDAQGVSLGQIAAVSNTSAQTLARHYLKPDRKQAFDRVRGLYTGQTTGGPQNPALNADNPGKGPQSDNGTGDKNPGVSDDK